MKYRAILFDFDGVLCKDYFYTNLKTSYPEVSEFISTKVFGKDGICNDWMKGNISSADVNKFISENTGIDFEELSGLFIESVNNMNLDDRLLKLANVFGENIKVAIVTNNMDVFNEITIKKNGLNKIFHTIVNSCDFGMLKHENDGKLFDIALEKIGIDSYENVLLIDDSSKAKEVFESRGGKTYTYTCYENFEPWMVKNLK